LTGEAASISAAPRVEVSDGRRQISRVDIRAPVGGEPDIAAVAGNVIEVDFRAHDVLVLRGGLRENLAIRRDDDASAHEGAKALPAGAVARLLLEVLLGNAALRLRWFYEVEHVSCILGLLEAGVGCAILPAMALPTNPGSNIRAVPISAPEIKRTVGVIRHRSLSISPMASEFLDLVTRHLGFRDGEPMNAEPM